MSGPDREEGVDRINGGDLHGAGAIPPIDRLRELVNDLGSEIAVNLRGPLFEASAPLDIQRIKAFREVQYRDRLNYLLCREQQQIEQDLDIDGRSAHFSAESDGRIVGSVRITPTPFEFESLSPSLAAMRPIVSGHVELSRLVVTTGASQGHVTTRLLVAASAWAMVAGYTGIVGLCRAETRTLLERYGLRPLSSAEHVVEWRGNQPYVLMIGSWSALAAATTRLSERLSALQESRLRRRNTPQP